ncbi:bifunctional methionine sulfoxide reductase B/A protein [bacterium]|nr:bifunctional methionine sulfoxide reductase B/A protein [bacterium]
MLKRINIILFLGIFVAACTGNSTPSQKAPESRDGEKNMVKKVIKTDKEWKRILTPEQYRVMRKGATEKPFTGEYNDHYEKGIYHCAGCGTPLFSSENKYDHGSGWPSFTRPVDKKYIQYKDDYSLLMKRSEVRCAVCGAHLGHVFSDGPPPTHKHYCINSISLDFKPDNQSYPPEESTQSKSLSHKSSSKKATFAGGCFWGVEYKFSQLKGVLSTTVGYTGGEVKKPTYAQVCTGNTGHAEAVHIIYDPSQITYKELLEYFFRIHDPTQINRQGPDRGTQYRSTIFYHTQEQKEAAQEMIARLNQSDRFNKPIATRIVPASKFYKAEDYHQNYLEKRKN